MKLTIDEIRNKSLGLLVRAKMYLARKIMEQQIRDHFDRIPKWIPQPITGIMSCVKIEAKVDIPE